MKNNLEKDRFNKAIKDRLNQQKAKLLKKTVNCRTKYEDF